MTRHMTNRDFYLNKEANRRAREFENAKIEEERKLQRQSNERETHLRERATELLHEDYTAGAGIRGAIKWGILVENTLGVKHRGNPLTPEQLDKIEVEIQARYELELQANADLLEYERSKGTHQDQ